MSSLPMCLQAVCQEFMLSGEPLNAREVHTGHINATWQVECPAPGGAIRSYILQSINRNVFRSASDVMGNVVRVTGHLRQRAELIPEESRGRTLTLVPARSGAHWLETDAGEIWRCFDFVEGCVTYDVVGNPQQAREAARAFGAFHHLLADMDPGRLAETIPGFHDTHARYRKFIAAVEADRSGRAGAVKREIEFIRERESSTRVLMDALAAGQLPLRVVHNDTKINNVMFHETTGIAECVIDLDTVMAGLVVHDFGDLARSSVSASDEDERDLAKVRLRHEVFEALVEGFLDGARSYLTDGEAAHLVTGAHQMTFEVGMRFLTDYLEGDIYFRTRRDGHNLDRARNQLKLVEEFECHDRELRALVANRWHAIRGALPDEPVIANPLP